MINNKKITLYTLFSTLLTIFIFGSSVLADQWPGDRWTNNDGTNITIKLEKSDIHTDTVVRFAAYLDGDTRSPNGDALTLSVIIAAGGCNLQNSARLQITKPSGATDNYEQCNNVPATLTPSRQNGIFMPEANMTRYEYKFVLDQPIVNQSSFEFNISYSPPVKVGFIGSENNTIPIAMSNRQKDFWTDLKIPLIAGAPACSAKGSTLSGSFRFYDFDSWNSLAGAQDNGGGIGNPDGWPGDFPNRQYEWRQLSMSIHKVGNPAGQNRNPTYKSIYNAGDKTVGWTDVSDQTPSNNNIFAPKSTSTSEWAFLTYALKSSNAYNLKINNLNGQNFLSFSSPFDENVGFDCGVEWSVVSDTGPDYQTITTGNSATINHYIRNIGTGSTDEKVEATVSGAFGGNDTSTLDLPVGTPASAAWQRSLPRSQVFNNPGRYWDSLTYTPVASDNSSIGSSSGYVDVIDPYSELPSKLQYEKGMNILSVSGTNIRVNNGGNCPTAPITIPYSWSIGALSGSSSFVYGGGSCGNLPSDIIPLAASIRDQLNQKQPGPSGIQYCLNVNNEGNRCGDIEVYEVPFARFYGNDVYSNGRLKFNDSFNDNANYTEQGSVAQYAAFVTDSNNLLDTAAFRYKSSYNPKPPTGLMSGSSYLTQNSFNVYNDVAKNLPENCLTTINPAAIPQSGSSICYDLGSSNVTLNSLNYSNKITIKTTGNIYVSGNITNATTAANKQNPVNTGVLLLSANNIFIDKGVTRADAILVASESINTCYNGGSKILNNQLDELCRSKLVINGSVSANNISFSRVGGSRLLAPLGAGANNDLGAGIEEKNGEASQSLTSGLSAEIINFPAYLYWAKPYLQDKSASGGTVESMFVAPPRK